VEDVLLLKPDRLAIVEANGIRQVVQNVYNFQVEGLHNYAVGAAGVLVHNNSPCISDVPGQKVSPTVYRGGNSLTPRAGSDYRLDKIDKKVHPTRGPDNRPQGLSVNVDPTNVNVQKDGAFQVSEIPEGLKLVQDGKDPGHYVIAPAYAMTEKAFLELLTKVKLLNYNKIPLR
jgi:hypothetical protein